MTTVANGTNERRKKTYFQPKQILRGFAVLVTWFFFHRWTFSLQLSKSNPGVQLSFHVDCRIWGCDSLMNLVGTRILIKKSMWTMVIYCFCTLRSPKIMIITLETVQEEEKLVVNWFYVRTNSFIAYTSPTFIRSICNVRDVIWKTFQLNLKLCIWNVLHKSLCLL